MRKSVGYLLKRELSQAWGAWVEMSAERAEVIRKLRKGASLPPLWSLGCAFSGWMFSTVSKVKALKHLMHQVQLSRGLHAWSDIAVERAESMRKLRKGASFMIIQRAALAFARWLSAMQTDRASKSLHHLFRQVQLARGWSAWLEMGAERGDFMLMMKMSMELLAHRELSRGLVGLLSAWKAGKANRESIHKRLGQVRNRMLSRGFGAWSKIADERAAFLLSLPQVASRLTKRKLVLGFADWCTAFEFDVGSARSISKARMHYVDCGLARGWRAWHATWEELTAKRESMRKGLGHLRSRCESRGFDAWMAMASDRAASMQLLRKGLRFMGERKVATALAAWMAQSKRFASMRKGLYHMRNRGLIKGWRAWKSMAKEGFLLGHRLYFVLGQGRMRSRALSRAVGLWVALCVERGRFTRKLLRMSFIEDYFVSLERSRGFGAWSQIAIERAELMQRQRKGASRFAKRKLELGFGGWCASCAPLGGLMSKAQVHLVNHELTRGWAAWMERAACAPRDDPMLKALVYFGYRERARAWTVWHTAWKEQTTKRESMVSELEKLDWALLHAAKLGHVVSVRALLRRGARVGMQDGLGQTALHAASFGGHAPIVRALLEPEWALETAPVDLDVRDQNGHTALGLASLRGHLDVMKLLMEAGAAVDRAPWSAPVARRAVARRPQVAEPDEDEEPRWLGGAGKDVGGWSATGTARALGDRLEPRSASEHVAQLSARLSVLENLRHAGEELQLEERVTAATPPTRKPRRNLSRPDRQTFT